MTVASACTTRPERRRTGARVTDSNRHRRTAAHARSIAGRSFLMPFVANAPWAATEAGRGILGRKFVSIFQMLFAHARRTRPTIQHIPGFRNPGFLLKGSARDCNV